MWQFVKGCVIIRIIGKYPERMLNSLREQGIFVRDARVARRGELTLAIRARDFHRLRPIARTCRCRVHIIGRGGLPFAMRRLFHRPVLLFGMLLAFGAIAFSSTRIMHITVEGCDRVPERLVLRALEEQGVRRFGAYPETPLADAAALARLYDERIAWLSLSLIGSHLTVTVTEMDPRVVTIDPDTPCDIVAVKGGVLTNVEAYEGYTALRAGDTVKAGDVLIEGEFFPETDEEVLEPLTVHARGRILANIYYYGEYAAEDTEEAYLDSGERTQYRRVAVCGKTLYETPAPYAHYEVRDVAVQALSDATLPVTVTDGTYYEQTLQRRKIARGAQTERALVEAERLAYLKIPKDAVIVDKSQRVIEMDGVLIGAVGVVTEESIGLEREIVH